MKTTGLLLSAAICSTISAQTLLLSSATIRSGKTQTLKITLTSPKPLSALQWRITLPEAIRDITAKSSVPDKAVTCNVNGREYICILVGGSSQLRNGEVATVKVTAKKVHKQTITVRVHDVMAADPDAKSIKIPDSETQIKIKP